jgi:hypothetical protein
MAHDVRFTAVACALAETLNTAVADAYGVACVPWDELPVARRHDLVEAVELALEAVKPLPPVPSHLSNVLQSVAWSPWTKAVTR